MKENIFIVIKWGFISWLTISLFGLINKDWAAVTVILSLLYCYHLLSKQIDLLRDAIRRRNDMLSALKQVDVDYWRTTDKCIELHTQRGEKHWLNKPKSKEDMLTHEDILNDFY